MNTLLQTRGKSFTAAVFAGRRMRPSPPHSVIMYGNNNNNNNMLLHYEYYIILAAVRVLRLSSVAFCFSRVRRVRYYQEVGARDRIIIIKS